MTAPRTITPTDIDQNGNVVVWDHGPPRDSLDYPEWRDENDSDLPSPILMHTSTAAHALSVDPERYALEPRGVSEAEVAAKIAEIQAARADTKKRAADAAAAAQLRADIAQAAQTVARRRAVEAAKPKSPRAGA